MSPRFFWTLLQARLNLREPDCTHPEMTRRLPLQTTRPRLCVGSRLPLPRHGGGQVRFVQLSGAVVATDLDGLAADFDFDGISIQLAVASRTSSFNHGFTLQYPKPGARAVGHGGREGRCQNL